MTSLFDKPAVNSRKPARIAPPTAPPAADEATALADAIRTIYGGVRADVVGELSAKMEALESIVANMKAPKADHFVVSAGKPLDVAISGRPHAEFGRLLQLASARNFDGARFNVLLVGPVGAGKTHACRMLADPLSLDSLAYGLGNSAFYWFRVQLCDLSQTTINDSWEFARETPTALRGDVHFPRVTSKADADALLRRVAPVCIGV
ncbi:MAG: hypothetical protein ACKV2Q_36570 [Planctomycetaceae bacterium]